MSDDNDDYLNDDLLDEAEPEALEADLDANSLDEDDLDGVALEIRAPTAAELARKEAATGATTLQAERLTVPCMVKATAAELDDLARENGGRLVFSVANGMIDKSAARYTNAEDGTEEMLALPPHHLLKAIRVRNFEMIDADASSNKFAVVFPQFAALPNERFPLQDKTRDKAVLEHGAVAGMLTVGKGGESVTVVDRPVSQNLIEFCSLYPGFTAKDAKKTVHMDEAGTFAAIQLIPPSPVLPHYNAAAKEAGLPMIDPATTQKTWETSNPQLTQKASAAFDAAARTRVHYDRVDLNKLRIELVPQDHRFIAATKAMGEQPVSFAQMALGRRLRESHPESHLHELNRLAGFPGAPRDNRNKYQSFSRDIANAADVTIRFDVDLEYYPFAPKHA